MKPQKLTLTIAVLCLTIFCFSCSWVTKFVIVNKSAETIEVEIKYENMRGDSYLMKTTLDDKGSLIDENWKNLTDQEIEGSRKESSIRVKLAPNEGLAIASDVTYTGHKTANAEFLRVNELNIKGSSGTIHLEDRAVLTQFRKESDSLYTIVYE